ncbi:MAG: hypothetical protein GXO49_04310 [Chlorobi bacterium]|nr:hypothetical protein [Chlorobiota bacterium]
MNNTEKCNRWFFDKQSGMDDGPNDAFAENFKAFPYYSIVRESIQNSLDAVRDEEKPVIVKYEFSEIDRKEFKKLIDGLENHIQMCKNTWNDKKFDDMLEYLNGNLDGFKRKNIPILKISDYNTHGMYYDPDDLKSSFYAFLLSKGNSAKKNVSSGGSFGFGKAAYFNLSPLKTILVSTKNDEQELFMGATILATHKNEQGQKLTGEGFYSCKDKEPDFNINEIPEKFLREEIGTDIYVIGLWDENNRKEEMIKSVLNNFWLAIFNEKLIVEIDGEIINEDNLPTIINRYYENEMEKSAKDIKTWNPKPYYKAVAHSESGVSGNYKKFEDILETAGKVKLYVYLNKDLPNRIAYFRKPQMLVYKRTIKKIKGYVAVFVCEDERGNRILKEMENPPHNEWKVENYQISGKPHPDAVKVEKEIKSFINSKLEEISSMNISGKASFLELDEYLNIPEDLIKDEENFDYNGENYNTKTGNVSSEISEDETGLQSTSSEKIKINPTIISTDQVKNEFEGNMDDENGEEESIIVGGEENKGEGGNQLGKEGDVLNNANVNDGDKIVKTPIDVKFRVVFSDNKHFLILNSKYPIENAEIEISVGTDNENDEIIKIVDSSKGKVMNNKITNLKLNHGKNIIEVKFEDNISHSINLKAYEIQ